MLSSAADALPGGEGWQFEPKWDGFRTLVFRDGDEILLQSRDEKTMNRYFPELRSAANGGARRPSRVCGDDANLGGASPAMVCTVATTTEGLTSNGK